MLHIVLFANLHSKWPMDSALKITQAALIEILKVYVNTVGLERLWLGITVLEF